MFSFTYDWVNLPERYLRVLLWVTDHHCILSLADILYCKTTLSFFALHTFYATDHRIKKNVVRKRNTLLILMNKTEFHIKIKKRISPKTIFRLHKKNFCYNFLHRGLAAYFIKMSESKKKLSKWSFLSDSWKSLFQKITQFLNL